MEDNENDLCNLYYDYVMSGFFSCYESVVM